MTFTLSVLKETRPGEKRVALSPAVTARLKRLGADISIEAGAGQAASFGDATYQGSRAVSDTQKLVADADVVLAVQPPAVAVVRQMKAGAILICFVHADELVKLLQAGGVDVKFAIHPVAGRMPGHMNVLLAEAGVPYDTIYDMADINEAFANTDVALVIGANDVVNPAARTDKSSPIYGMPILNADRARQVYASAARARATRASRTSSSTPTTVQWCMAMPRLCSRGWFRPSRKLPPSKLPPERNPKTSFIP